ncbi:MAG: serine/threonine protein kinase [Deltaproteobacteria bacterium]|nr:serine/threonine protein kinase [Deltaproteobacteria bacterium]MBW2535932.1 serine/threonine protein kinase [Deltaproteobacteria bacterium]
MVDERYRIERLIGAGGMGAVYAAQQLSDGRPVAVKVMLATEARNPDATGRFLREARAARAIDSEHVVTVEATGRCSNGLPYMVMELLAGQGLDRLIREQAPLPIPTAVEYLLQACEGVAHAHAAGVIHRDLKPSNLYAARGDDGPVTIKVLDFGIAKALPQLDPDGGASSLTRSATLLGSPKYMSPEQLRCSKRVDARADVWSLGVILYRMLTGRLPFEAKGVGAQLAAVLSDEPKPLREHRADAPAGLEEVIVCCLQKQVGSRYQDVGQLAEALAPFVPAGGAERVTRVRATLDAANASSPSLPEPSATSTPSFSAPSFDRSATIPRSSLASSPSLTDPSSAEVIDAALPVDEPATLRAEHDSQSGTHRPLHAPSGATPSLPARGWLVGVAVVVAGTIAAAAYLLVAVVAAPSAVATQEEGSTLEVDTADSGVQARQPTKGAQPLPATSSVQLHLTLEPPDARVEVDGVAVGSNPILLPRTDRIHALVVSAPGYVSERREFVARSDGQLQIELQREPPDAGASSSASAQPPPSRRPSPPAPRPRPAGPPLVSPKGPIADHL